MSQPRQESKLSIILFMIGTVTARVGLWSFDMAIMQLFQEQIKESQRNIISSVHSSLVTLRENS